MVNPFQFAIYNLLNNPQLTFGISLGWVWPVHKLHNGWFQEISILYYGWHEYFNPPLPSEIPKCLSPPCPPNSKIANPPLLRNFPLLFQTLWNIPVRLPKTSNERETCTSSLCKRILFTIFSQTIKRLEHFLQAAYHLKELFVFHSIPSYFQE